MKKYNLRSSDLFQMPNFLKGMARVSDLEGKLDRYRTRRNADAHALKLDWKNVGSYVYDAIEKYEQKR